MADNNQLMRQMHSAAEAGDWNTAIEAAKHVPRGWNAFDQLPQYGLPPEAVDNFIDSVPEKDKPNVMFELANNLHPDLKNDHLRRILSEAPNDHIVQSSIKEHPNYKPLPEEHMPSEFWRSYERRVTPDHFAAIKSLFSGKPETIKSHRSDTQSHGHSHHSFVQDGQMFSSEGEGSDEGGSYFMTSEAIPHLKDHAKKVQDAILNDPSIDKKTKNGKTYVKLYRGVGGNYGKKLKDAANFDQESHSVEDSRLKIPTASFSSWTQDPEMARRFAGARGEIPGQEKGHGVVMSAYHPIESILHSGFHSVHPGQEHAHENESEIIIGHPEGKMVIPTRSLEIQNKDAKPHEYTTAFKPVKARVQETIKKSEFRSWDVAQILISKSLPTT